ncbi:hypothetical protein [Cellulomonas endometrii]|uniref:hypothetical protein n=1 Tax=Cellulomonas endometrii TaxID=3036301 RepID=UPI0024ADDA77|nr:hypothetical protein [Cellulomonas endometrii]
MDLSNWTEPAPGVTLTPQNEDDWTEAVSRYRGSKNDVPFDRCIQIARSHGARHIVIETRFADLDYRSEHHALYGREFADVPAYAHRLHFFAGHIGEDQTDLPEDHRYIGYVTVRPVSTGLVSRAMLPPPADAPGAQCAVEETIHLFGQPLTVRGVPFSQQDSRLGACAHTAAWVCHYTAVLRGDVERRPRADFALLANSSLSAGRAVPTKGLTSPQIGALMTQVGLPAEFHLLGSLPSSRLPWQHPQPHPPTDDLEAAPGTWDTRLFPVICWYVNGGYPVIVGTHDHAFTIVGWSRDPDEPWRILFRRHDDQRGPYLTVHDPLDDQIEEPEPHHYGPWKSLQIPLPADLWLEPEGAERTAGDVLRSNSAETARKLAARGTHVESLDELIADKRLALRTYPILSENFKANLPGLGIDPHHVTEYRRQRMPRHVWVVEAVDRTRRNVGEPCVIGEAVLDASSPENDVRVLAVRIHGLLGRTDSTRPVLTKPTLTNMGGSH